MDSTRQEKRRLIRTSSEVYMEDYNQIPWYFVPLAWLCLIWKPVVSPVCHVLSDSWLLLFLTFNRRTALKKKNYWSLKAMLTVQLLRVNLFPIYCQVRRPGFYWSFLMVHLYQLATVKFPFPENCFLANAVTIFFVNIRTCYFFLFLIPSNKSRVTS